MKKISTVTTKKVENNASQKLTIGLDLGDRFSWYCILDEAGEVVLEQKVATTAKAMKGVFRGMPRSRLGLETGTHSPWVRDSGTIRKVDIHVPTIAQATTRLPSSSNCSRRTGRQRKVRCAIRSPVNAGAARYRPCAALPAPRPRSSRFLPAASGLPDQSPHSRASTNGLPDGAHGAGKDAPDSSDPGSAVAHAARVKSAACQSYSPPCRPRRCVGCAETPAGEAPVG